MLCPLGTGENGLWVLSRHLYNGGVCQRNTTTCAIKLCKITFERGRVVHLTGVTDDVHPKTRLVERMFSELDSDALKNMPSVIGQKPCLSRTEISLPVYRLFLICF